ncbi:SDR family NAD(P)-dependent oxidoreductase [Nocardia sp. NPDC101769]|uniref:SDR family NAD(P)-dependent oxidoreductase n=1 Tax=Nocardia sp. NPDC101769 TaxID=3364333 RepID=UPI00381136D8
MSASPIKTRDLTGRVVVITGAGSGIGRELALQCADRGASLAICDRNRASLHDTATTARAAGSQVFDATVDVCDAEQMTRFANDVTEQLAAPDLVINNAGIAVIGGILDTTLDDWNRLVGVNLMGVVHGVAAFAPAMVERGSGHLVNVSSAAGMLANPQLGAYSTTKFAIFGMTEALRMELAPHGIAVTTICPGVINTAITCDSTYRGGNEQARRAKINAAYAKRGYTPERAARNILAAIDRGKAVAPIAPEAHLIYILSRIAPPLARWASVALANIAK